MAKSKNNESGAKQAAKIVKKVAPGKSEIKKAAKKSGSGRAVPYIITIFGLLMLIIMLFNAFDAAGSLLRTAEQFFRSIIGGAAIWVLPFALMYLGIVWIIVHLKEHSAKRNKSEDEAPIGLTRKGAVRRTLNSALFIVTFSSFIGILSDIRVYDFVSLFEEAERFDFLYGGILGGSIGYLMTSNIAVALSAIIMAFPMLISLFYALGFTVTGIFDTVSARKDIENDDLDIDEDAEARRFEAIRQKEIEKAKKRKLKELHARQKEELRQIKEENEYGDEDYYEEPEVPAPPKKKNNKKETPAPAFDDEDFLEGFDDTTDDVDVYEDPVTISLQASNESEAEAEGVTEYGGDPILDEASSSLDDLLAGIGEPEPAPKPSEPIHITKISNEDLTEDLAGVAPDEKDDDEEEEALVTPYIFPPLDMLSPNKNPVDTDIQAELNENAETLKKTLSSFNVKISDISYSRGPTITRYELKPEIGTRVRTIANLVDDIALSLATTGVRIEAPIPNKAAVGIEVPNKHRATVYLRDLIENSKFTDSKSKLTSSLGMDVGGNPVYFDIGKMPHLLIAGTTGSGKSVCINTIILSILYKARPDEVKLILIDPKQVEFTVYENIPHLYCPIVSEPKKAAGALASAVSEMERRFELIKSVGVRNIESYNEVTANDPEKEYLPKMVIIIDELADLMMTARDEVETSICRLAQKARAAGIHVVLGTQRPSVDVITGLIKANVPSRIACTVTSQVDSRTIIDVAGAENLIGYGDMLFAPVGSSKPMRVQGAFVSDPEVEQIVNFIKENNGSVKYNTAFIESMEENARNCGAGKKGSSAGADFEPSADDGGDSKFKDAVRLAIETGKISTSLMQRKLSVGYGRAAKIIDTMEELGYISKADGNKPRQVLITMEEYMNRINEGTLGADE